MLEELCKRIQHCCATLRRSRNKRNVGSCWLKSLTGFKLCATTCNKVCKRTQHVTSNNVGSCWPKMLRPFARGLKKPVETEYVHYWLRENCRGSEGKLWWSKYVKYFIYRTKWWIIKISSNSKAINVFSSGCKCISGKPSDLISVTVRYAISVWFFDFVRFWALFHRARLSFPRKTFI